jgi:mono/diheme cytochrome c family protein
LRTPDKVADHLEKGLADGGRKLYNTYCASCHQVNGKGVMGRFPTLSESEWVSGNKKRLISVILAGLKGPITVNGKAFDGEMPKHDFLSDDNIAKILTYIRKNFKNNAGAIYEKDVASMRGK